MPPPLPTFQGQVLAAEEEGRAVSEEQTKLLVAKGTNLVPLLH